MVEKIVLAVDGGEASDAAVRWTAARAAERDSEIVITTAIPFDERAVDHPRHDAAVQAARSVLGSVTRAPMLREHIRHGDPLEQLVEASQSADLLVVGTNRTSGIASLLHLTLPLQLAGRTACPMVVVPATWQGHAGPVAVGWQDDGSADAAVQAAAAEAAATERTLYVVHAWTLPPVNAYDPQGSAELYERVLGDQRALLDGEVRRIRQVYPTLAVHAALHSGGADATLSDLGEHASLLVVGSHARGPLADLVTGSVGDDLIRAMRCPVMILPVNERAPISVYPVTENEEP